MSEHGHSEFSPNCGHCRANRIRRQNKVFAIVVGAVVALALVGGSALVIHFRADRSDQRAACVEAGGVPMWQGSRPPLCLAPSAVVVVPQ